jgi:hypothetical protein
MRRDNSITGWLVAALLAVAAALAIPCLAQQDNQDNNVRPPAPRDQYRQPPSYSGPGHAGDWLRRYKNVPPDQQEQALQSDPAFRHLPPEQQQMLRQRLRHFSSLPPQQQQRMLQRMETWEHLTPEQKQWALHIHAQMQQLPPERRHMIRTAVEHLSVLSPEHRQRIIDSPRYRSVFSPQERDIMREALRLPLASPENRRGDEEYPAPQ